MASDRDAGFLGRVHIALLPRRFLDSQRHAAAVAADPSRISRDSVRLPGPSPGNARPGALRPHGLPRYSGVAGLLPPMLPPETASHALRSPAARTRGF